MQMQIVGSEQLMPFSDGALSSCRKLLCCKKFCFVSHQTYISHQFCERMLFLYWQIFWRCAQLVQKITFLQKILPRLTLKLLFELILWENWHKEDFIFTYLYYIYFISTNRNFFDGALNSCRKLLCCKKILPCLRLSQHFAPILGENDIFILTNINFYDSALSSCRKLLCCKKSCLVSHSTYSLRQFRAFALTICVKISSVKEMSI